MNIKKYLDYREYPDEIPIARLFEVNERILSDLYSEGDEVFQHNILLILFHNYYSLKERDYGTEVAQICYLISYYIFILLTPPNFGSLAFVYAKKATKYCEKKKYYGWLCYLQENIGKMGSS